jgi:hypothetical protein
MSDDTAFDTQNVVIELYHRPPPEATNIIAQFYTKRPEVIDA